MGKNSGFFNLNQRKTGVLVLETLQIDGLEEISLEKRLSRLQKVLSECGFTSRRKAEQMIEEGRVTVNGRPAGIGQKVGPKDFIAVDGVKVDTSSSAKKHVYLMLNKPRGYVTTMSDELGRRDITAFTQNVGTRVYPVGRLDRNSEGLLLLTNDGEFANIMMHPRHHVSKRYRVTVRPDITDEQLVALSEGVTLDDGTRTLPADVRIIDRQEGRVVVDITLYEGKNRQIRRMCETVGLEVARLKRVAIGPIRLGMLKVGAWRYLSKEEIDALKAEAGQPSSKNRAPRTRR